MFPRLEVFLFSSFLLFIGDFARGAPSSSLDLPTYGISVLPPRGMVQIIETSPDEIAVWSRVEKGTGRIVEVVRIEILHSEGHNLAQIASESAKQAGGEVAKRGFKLAGMPALSCEFKNPRPAQAGELATTAMFLAARKELIYRASIQSALIGGNLRSSDMQPLIESWKWEEIVSPGSRLELRREPTLVFDQLGICLPAILRPYPADDSTMEMSFGVEDYRRESTDFLITFSRIPKEENEPFAAFWREPLGIFKSNTPAKR